MVRTKQLSDGTIVEEPRTLRATADPVWTTVRELLAQVSPSVRVVDSRRRETSTAS